MEPNIAGAPKKKTVPIERGFPGLGRGGLDFDNVNGRATLGPGHLRDKQLDMAPSRH